jgi:hypothetical protein
MAVLCILLLLPSAKRFRVQIIFCRYFLNFICYTEKNCPNTFRPKRSFAKLVPGVLREGDGLLERRPLQVSVGQHPVGQLPVGQLLEQRLRVEAALAATRGRQLALDNLGQILRNSFRQ